MKGHLCNWGEQCPAFTAWHNTMSRRVRVFDNGGKTVDRYSVLIKRIQGGRSVIDIYGMSEDPSSPRGVNQFSHSAANQFRDFAYLGTRVQVQDLPDEVIRAVEHRLYGE